MRRQRTRFILGVTLPKTTSVTATSAPWCAAGVSSQPTTSSLRGSIATTTVVYLTRIFSGRLVCTYPHRKITISATSKTSRGSVPASTPAVLRTPSSRRRNPLSANCTSTSTVHDCSKLSKKWLAYLQLSNSLPWRQSCADAAKSSQLRISQSCLKEMFVHMPFSAAVNSWRMPGKPSELTRMRLYVRNLVKDWSTVKSCRICGSRRLSGLKQSKQSVVQGNQSNGGLAFQFNNRVMENSSFNCKPNTHTLGTNSGNRSNPKT